MGKGKKGKSGVVYSTNPDYDYSSNDFEETLDASAQKLYVYRDSKKRKGKTATVIEGFVGSADDLKDLGKHLKSKLGVGGSAKDGEIIIQGDLREKVKALLEAKGYAVKLKGG